MLDPQNDDSQPRVMLQNPWGVYRPLSGDAEPDPNKAGFSVGEVESLWMSKEPFSNLLRDWLRKMQDSMPSMLQKIVSISILILFAGLFLAGSGNVWAQSRRVVVTTEAGLKYDGKLFNIEEISVETGDVGTGAVKPVVVVNDGLRRIFLNQYSLLPNIVDSTRNETELEIWQRVYEGPRKGAAPFLFAEPFNDNGHRILTVRTTGGRAQYIQGITKLNPRYVKVQSLSGGTNLAAKDWEMSLAIGTIPTAVLKGVLENEIVDPEQVTAWLRIPDFLYQAGRYSDAKDELLRIAERFPNQKEQIEAKRLIVLQDEAKQQLREILLTFEAGQTELGTKWIQSIDRKGLAPETTVELDDLLDQVDRTDEKREKLIARVVAAVEKMESRPKGQLTQEQTDALKRFKEQVKSDLNQHNLLRLDSFDRLSADPKNKDQQNVALAISGWLLGSNNATDNWAVAQSLYSVLDLVQEYLTSAEESRRTAILEELAKYESSDVSFLAPLLANMLPPKHELVGDYSGREPIEFFVTLDGTKIDPEPKQYRCLAHLPTEYDPYHRYPMMLSLPGRAKVENQLKHWCGEFNEGLGVRYGHASRNGTIVVAIDWRAPEQRRADYSVREHLIVMKALRESMRRFSVDSDRVFLQGHGIGADVAYDVGTAHPEHWAGIIGVSATGIRKYPLIYAENTGNRLPIYAVVGERHIGSMRGCKDAWNAWLTSKNRKACTVVQYLGRLDEQFREDVPEAFKWMRAQRRRYPDRSGFEFSCKSIRPADNYFWFLEIHGFPQRNIKWPELFRERRDISALEIDGKIRSGKPNAFVVGKAGTGATLWLRPDYFDFNREIEINGRGRRFTGSVTASREVLLEDARTRADRQRPYWAKLDYVNGTWVP